MSKMKRLIRADNLTNVYKNTFKNLGKDGRKLLKQVEEYKYKVNQAKNIFNDDKMVKQVEKCIEDLNNVSAFIYDFVFDLENYDIVDNHDRQIEFTVPKEKPIEDTDEEIDNKDFNNEEIDEDLEEPTDEDTDENQEDNEDLDDEDMSALFDKANENDDSLEEPLK